MLQRKIVFLIVVTIGVTVLSAGRFDFAGVAYAAHTVWDQQGHDAAKTEQGEETDPGDDDCNNKGSPFEVATGNFIYRSQDLFITALGPDIEITRTYNSLDRRSGPFGNGWTFTYDQRLIETTDGVNLFVICRQGHGKRERFVRNPDGTYAPPSDLFYQLTKHSDGTFTLRGKHGTRRLFDAAGRLIALVDRNDNQMTFDYDETGFLTKVTDAPGRTLTFTKGPNGKVESITDPTGRVYRYNYDDEASLVRFRDSAGNTTKYAYDEEHHLVQVISHEGHVALEAGYDDRGRLASLEEDGKKWVINYFPDERKTVKEGSQGDSWTFFYNENGNIVREVDPKGNVKGFSYDENFLMTEVNENGDTCVMAYDKRGNIISKTNALGYTRKFTYEAIFNYVTAYTDVYGDTTHFEYDAKGNLVKITNEEGQVTSLNYDGDGRLIEIIDLSGRSSPMNREARDIVDNPARELNRILLLAAMCKPSIDLTIPSSVQIVPGPDLEENDRR